MAQVTKDMFISDIIRTDNGVIPILMNAGMPCVGCASAQGETLEEACEYHRTIDADALIHEINTYLETINA